MSKLRVNLRYRSLDNRRLGNSIISTHRLLYARYRATHFEARWYTTEARENKDLDVTHSHFLAEAPSGAKWHPGGLNGNSSSQEGQPRSGQDDLPDGVTETRGKSCLPQDHHHALNSHDIFKLILPLGRLSHPSSNRIEPTNHKKQRSSPTHNTPPTVFLLHPSQPLSHVSRLILASLAPATPSVSFRSVSSNGQAFQWSGSTDVGDFIRDAAHAAEFTICMSYGPEDARKRLLPSNGQEDPRMAPIDAGEIQGGEKVENGITETLLTVTVPTFADRTRFLRRRLNFVIGKLKDMEGLKQKCDQEARQGARKMALGGFGMLIVYWGAVARLTFWDYGWDVMEPITYLSGLSTVILGYLWFLYQGREVSYTSVLARSISARREVLYKAKGFNIDHWMELIAEKRALRAEIGRIARDYEGDDDNSKGADEAEVDSGPEREEGLQDEGRGTAEQEAQHLLQDGRTGEVEDREDKDIYCLNEENVDVDRDEEHGKRQARKADRAGL
ncbi:unnamed protein product [Cyclocybe aegerita]|uniref:Calcium uniporter protein, mitochondrial n=1 Tax=Cyclocybe aegerita TaxID=1973307 RepID=A0A8S0WR97_CYCAE|nr:unnamed protein product [Cyclocybe aegerita]